MPAWAYEYEEMANMIKLTNMSTYAYGDSLEMSNIEDETAILQFEFDEKVFIYGTITDSEDIKFIRNEEENKDKTSVTLTGFEIIIKASNQEKIAKAKEQTAPRLTNILSSITGIAINYNPPRVRRIKDGKTFHEVLALTLRMPWLRPIGISNIDVSKAFALLADTSKSSQELNMKLVHAHNGQRALSNNDFPHAIREFYLVVENTSINDKDRYKTLRDAVSHYILDVDRTIKNLKKFFSITLAPGQSLDVNDPEIRKILADEAKKLREAVGYYLNGQLKNEIS